MNHDGPTPMIDFTLSPEPADRPTRLRQFIAEQLIPLEADPARACMARRTQPLVVSLKLVL